MIVGIYRVVRIDVRDLGNGVYRVEDAALVGVDQRRGVRLPSFAAEFVDDLLICSRQFGVPAVSGWSGAWALSDGAVVSVFVLTA